MLTGNGEDHCALSHDGLASFRDEGQRLRAASFRDGGPRLRADSGASRCTNETSWAHRSRPPGGATEGALWVADSDLPPADSHPPTTTRRQHPPTATRRQRPADSYPSTALEHGPNATWLASWQFCGLKIKWNELVMSKWHLRVFVLPGANCEPLNKQRC